MVAFLTFLHANPYILLFFVVGLSVWVGRGTIKGYGLGAVASAIVIGCGVATWGAAFGVRFQLDNFTKSLFYYRFMYGVGLRVGPSFVNSLKGDGLKFTVQAIVSSFLGLGLVVLGTRWLALPVGAAGGILAGSQTMSAATGSAEQAVTSGAVTLPAGTTAADATVMIALSYGVTYIWGHGRHHPDLQVPAALVASGCARGGEEIRSGARRSERGRRRPERLPPVRPARLPAHQRRLDRQDRGAVPRALHAVSGRRRGTRQAPAGRRPGAGAATWRRDRARRQPGRADRPHGLDRPRGARCAR